MVEVKGMESNQNTEDFFRFNFNQPIGASLAIEEIKGTKVKANNTMIQVKDFSASGLSFESELEFPLREDVVYSFHTKILEKDVELRGFLSHQEAKEGNKFEYGVVFQFEAKKELLQQELVQLVSCLQITSRHGKKKGMNLLASLSV